MKRYTSGKIDQVQLEDMITSEKTIGQIYPVITDARGKIIDGLNRKRVNPRWKKITLPVKDPLESLKLRIHLNIVRRQVPAAEKSGWVAEARKLLRKRGIKASAGKIARVLGMSQAWVSKYDPDPAEEPEELRSHRERPRFFGYNVWGFRDGDWHRLLLPADPNQPWPKGYRGATPAFVIHQLIQMFEPRRVLDSMAGVGTTGYVSGQYGIACDQFDLYPFPKQGVRRADAEKVEPGKTYDLIFNHIPYLSMVRYGSSPRDLSNMRVEEFFGKLGRIFDHNRGLLEPGGIYAVLVGDWRRGGELIPIAARTTLLGPRHGYRLRDQAIKLTGEMKSKSLQEYRAAKFGYLAQTYDTVLIFEKE